MTNLTARTLKICTTVVAIAFASSAKAQHSTGHARTTGEITLYGWLSGYGGSIRPGSDAPTYKVNRSFGEIFEDLDNAFFATGLVRHGRFTALADVTHTSSSAKGTIQTGNPAAPTVPAKGGLSQTSVTALGGYSVIDDGTLTLDLLAGGRAWWVQPRLEVAALSLSRKPKENFVDPIIAARANIALAPRWSALAYADVGGFGAASDFTGQAVGTVNYLVGRSLWLSGGYRYQRVNYDRNGIKVNSRLSGPVIGATLAF